MPRPLEPIAGDIPDSLKDADETLTHYGRWAASRLRRRTCGSAEGAYRAAPTDEDRAPRYLGLTNQHAMAAQRALARVPTLQRVVLVALYIPQRLPAEAQLRMLGVPPRLSRERHLSGLIMFRNNYQAMLDDGSAMV